jgi:hypothetical protein
MLLADRTYMVLVNASTSIEKEGWIYFMRLAGRDVSAIAVLLAGRNGGAVSW